MLLTENQFPGTFDHVRICVCLTDVVLLQSPLLINQFLYLLPPQLLLVEPMVIRLAWFYRLIINSRFNPLYRKTMSRRRTFASVEEAEAFFLSRKALSRLHPEAIAAYVEGEGRVGWLLKWRLLHLPLCRRPTLRCPSLSQVARGLLAVAMSESSAAPPNLRHRCIPVRLRGDVAADSLLCSLGALNYYFPAFPPRFAHRHGGSVGSFAYHKNAHAPPMWPVFTPGR